MSMNMDLIVENDRKMRLMAKQIGDEYFDLLGKIVYNTGSIQEAIDRCWDKFKDRIK